MYLNEFQMNFFGHDLFMEIMHYNIHKYLYEHKDFKKHLCVVCFEFSIAGLSSQMLFSITEKAMKPGKQYLTSPLRIKHAPV